MDIFWNKTINVGNFFCRCYTAFVLHIYFSIDKAFEATTG